MKFLNILKTIITTGITFLGLFVGGFDKMIMALLVMMTIDYITGVLKSIINKKVSSEIGFKGICKKILIILLVGIATILDNELNFTGVRFMIIGFYIANEGISIIENSAKMGVKIPTKLKEILEQLNEKGN